ncbi:MAG TPA: hypothetical protein VFA32_13095, partial [Dehalococcoidia bacterium]|nr:hypothetical protein [Dehalococcoidia bacterium]
MGLLEVHGVIAESGRIIGFPLHGLTEAVDHFYRKQWEVIDLFIVLQFPLSSQAATAMACLGYLLVPTPPAGPANDLRWRVSRDPQEADQ